MTELEEFNKMREELGWSQQRMAEAIGLGPSQFNFICNGKTPLHKLHLLAVRYVYQKHISGPFEKWEYKAYSTYLMSPPPGVTCAEVLTKELTELGNRGWEICGVVEPHVLLKRKAE